MKQDSPWWRFGGRGTRQALGCALSEAGAALVRLARVQAGQVRVVAQTLVDWPLPALHAPQDDPGMPGREPPHEPPGLQQALQEQRPLAHRCVLALPESACASGQLPWPADAAEDLLEAEVLLEAAQALQLPLTSIGYDFEARPGGTCGWIAAPLDTLSHWRRTLRAAGLRLQAVESQEQAARRALALIEGEGAALWRQAPQDWRFRSGAAWALDPEPQPDLQAFRADARVTHIWPQLVACGLALRCWQEEA